MVAKFTMKEPSPVNFPELPMPDMLLYCKERLFSNAEESLGQNADEL